MVEPPNCKIHRSKQHWATQVFQRSWFNFKVWATLTYTFWVCLKLDTPKIQGCIIDPPIQTSAGASPTDKHKSLESVLFPISIPPIVHGSSMLVYTRSPRVNLQNSMIRPHLHVLCEEIWPCSRSFWRQYNMIRYNTIRYDCSM